MHSLELKYIYVSDLKTPLRPPNQRGARYKKCWLDTVNNVQILPIVISSDNEVLSNIDQYEVMVALQIRNATAIVVAPEFVKDAELIDELTEAHTLMDRNYSGLLAQIECLVLLGVDPESLRAYADSLVKKFS